ncbi:MBL fold metallo-hydrolase [Marivivens sp. LCG002]|uniref:MBL fold metallo-hydrolase n=1 Tax=Marivivens sp. LCG002 TaxID=3051171 RepID=UPI0025522DC7|nr:MBL fold metallo-hydrolase [Marivivens sp. LCG002]WIV50169.1 MBL fold metallo-hydrolase [Marivivens sp. LCG002]
MKLSRRFVLGGLVAGATSIPLRALAQLDLGSVSIETLSDGNLVLPPSMFLADRPFEDAFEILRAGGFSTEEIKPDCNVTLLRDGTNTVLFDVGAGPNFMPSAGTLLDSLDALGVSPEEITHVLFTHGHPDHLWGVLDDFDEPVFMNARHLMSRVERDYWLDPATPDSLGEERLAFAAGAIRMIETLGDTLETFEDGEEILPGIFSVPTNGHTPGHTSFRITSGSEEIVVIGDAIGNAHVAFAEPLWHSGSDQDTVMGAETRLNLLTSLAQSASVVVGYHFPFPGMGRVETEGNAFRYTAL